MRFVSGLNDIAEAFALGALRVGLDVEGDAEEEEMAGRYRSGYSYWGFLELHCSPHDGNLPVKRKSLVSFLR